MHQDPEPNQAVMLGSICYWGLTLSVGLFMHIRIFAYSHICIFAYFLEAALNIHRLSTQIHNNDATFDGRNLYPPTEILITKPWRKNKCSLWSACNHRSPLDPDKKRIKQDTTQYTLHA
jgi:hypothetical protein